MPSRIPCFAADTESLSPFFPLAQMRHFGFFSQAFAKELSQSAEFSFAPGDDTLEITIEGRGPSFHDAITKLAGELEVDQSHISALRKVDRFFPGTGTLLKTDFHREKEGEISIYYQTQLSLKLASSCAHLLGLPAFPSGEIAALGKLLGRKGVYMGIDLMHGGAPACAIFFPIPAGSAREILLPGLLTAMEILSCDGWQKSLIGRRHNELISSASGDLFISVLFRDMLVKAIKIDYENVPVPRAYQVLKELEIERNEIIRMVNIAGALGTRTLSYFGIKLAAGRPALPKFYFKRPYWAAGDEVELFARYLESSYFRI
ncbi:MAG: hypothetical protein RDV48_27745 [Candidatus Eremiobacteraeota bacterium]|nr:hypothetical protein [Candidatus Eremiobacteraeota bacterium]